MTRTPTSQAMSNRRTQRLSRDVDRDRLAQMREQASGSAGTVWQRLVYLSAVLLAWLVRETRIRVPQAADGCGRG